MQQRHNEVYTLAQAVEDSKKESESIIESLDPKLKIEIERKLRNKFLDESGLSTELAISILQKEVDFKTTSLEYSDLRNTISELQEKNGLRPDGMIGPATSLLIMSIAVKYNENEAMKDIRSNERRRPLLSYPFLSRERGLIRIITDENHELHKPMLKVLRVTDNITSKDEVLRNIDRY